MWNRYKILLLPLLVYVAGAVSLYIEDSPIQKNLVVGKGFPFPPDQGTKTEWHIPNQPAKISRSITFIIFTPKLIEVKRTLLFIHINEEDPFYSFFFYSDKKGRSPPFKSC